MSTKHLFLLVCLLLAACASPDAQTAPGSALTPSTGLTHAPGVTPRPTQTLTPTPLPSITATVTVTPTPQPVYLTGAGDISICGQEGDNQTAALLAGIPGEIFTAGDNSNEDGAAWQYQKCFDESWGQFKDRLHPAAGNHDYYTPGAQPYYAYFGAAAGNPGEGWYSYDTGGWHIVVLNSNCNDVACGKDSAQIAWLRADLAASGAQCTLAVWHHPRWSSGLAGSDGRMSPAYRVLYEYGAEVVVSGHAHDYERLAPLDPEGKRDPQRGIRQFVVGTGGVNYLPFPGLLPESEAHDAGTFGVLRFTLYPDRYAWDFIPVEGQTFTDGGYGICHE
jgi:hypothetical protein